MKETIISMGEDQVVLPFDVLSPKRFGESNKVEISPFSLSTELEVR